MFCPQCGSQMPDGAAFCAACGASLFGPGQNGQAPAMPLGGEDGAGQAADVPSSAYAPVADPVQVSSNDAAAPAVQVDGCADAAAPVAQAVGYADAAAPAAQPADYADAAAPAVQVVPDLPNAKKGVKNMYTGEAMMLCSAAVSAGAALITVVVGLVTNSSAAFGALSGLTGMVSFFAAIFALIGFVEKLSGFFQASKDQKIFLAPFILTLVVVVYFAVTVLVPVLASVGALRMTNSSIVVYTSVVTVGSWVSIAANVAIIICLYYGIMLLAKRLGRQDVASSGKVFMIVSLVLYLLAMILPEVPIGSASTATVISVVATLISIVPDILQLVYLSKAKKMFP